MIATRSDRVDSSNTFMQVIKGVFFEPVGCLADFPSDQFLEIATRLFGRRKRSSPSGSRSYWHLLNLIQAANKNFDESERQLIEALEVQAVEAAHAYEDVVPAVSELKTMGVELFLTTSLSATAAEHFLERSFLKEFFSAVWNRDNAGGVKTAPLACALGATSLKPEEVIFLTDTLEGLKVSKTVGIPSILMMNDPDEAMRLAMRNPAGGIVSLHELPDFIRLVADENGAQPGNGLAVAG
jgi:beta-phosphoglucomutase-like phosphatase (HAD superfamily)